MNQADNTEGQVNLADNSNQRIGNLAADRANEEVRVGATEDTEYRPDEGLSPIAWRNLKIVLVTGGIAGNLIMRYGLVEELNIAYR